MSSLELSFDNCDNCGEVHSHEFATIQELRLQEDQEGVQIYNVCH